MPKTIKKMNKKILFLSVALLIGIGFFAGIQFSLADDGSGAASVVSTQPSITVLSPNGGEKYQIGDTINIGWNASNVLADTTVSLQLSYNLNGSTLEDVITPANLSPDLEGKYSWVIPARYGGNGMKPNLFKMRAILSGPNIPGFNPPQDYSDFYFTIGSSSAQPSVTIVSPNGGETFKNDGSPITVSWQTNNISSSQKFDIIRLRALSNSQEYDLAHGILNDGQEVLSIPASVPVGAYTLEIKTYIDNVLAMDSSDSYFKIVDVSQNQPIIITPIATVPSSTGVSQNHPTVVTSPVDVTQNTSSVTVMSPNGGENFQSGGSYNIKWTSNNLPSNAFVNVWLLDSSTRLGNMILAKVPNTGISNWVASSLNILTDQTTLQPIRSSGKYVIFIECADRNCTADYSNDSFVITVSSTKVEEQVKCIFKGSISGQKCYTATDSSSNYSGYGCSGTESCVVDMKGINGDKISWKSSCGGYAYTIINGSNEYAVFNCADQATVTPNVLTTPVTANPTTMAVKEKEEQISDINEKSKLLSNNNFDFILAELNQLRNTIKEQQTEIKYLKSLVMDVKDLSEKSQDAINKFITYGVDVNTEKLGAGERAAVINSYKAAFDKLPETEAELADAIKIANGRFPLITSDDAEKKANEQFVKIYKRLPDLSDANDNAAIKVMAYGLRQKAENRNLDSEKAGIKIFKNIFGAVPVTTEDWNTMQAITYSGATR